MAEEVREPVFRVKKGRASDEELAALAAVLLALPRRADPVTGGRLSTPSGWWRRRTTDYEAPGSWH